MVAEGFGGVRVAGGGFGGYEGVGGESWICSHGWRLGARVWWGVVG